MKNCLVTTLKGIVNNDFLTKINEFPFVIKEAVNTSFGFLAPASCNARIAGDGHFSNSSYSQDLGKTATLASNTTYYIVATGKCKVFIEDNYSLTAITFTVAYTDSSSIISRPLSTIGVRIDDVLDKAGSLASVTSFSCRDGAVDMIAFSGNSVLEALNLNHNIKATGDITALANCPIKGIVNFNECVGVYGNISNLGKCVLATNIPIAGSNISGTIESLIEELYSNGKTSGTLMFNGNGIVTFHENILANNYGGQAVFSSGSVAVYLGSSVVGTYNGSTWTYAS